MSSADADSTKPGPDKAGKMIKDPEAASKGPFKCTHPPEDISEESSTKVVKKRPTIDLASINVSPSDLFKQRFDIDPRGGSGAKESGKIGAEIGKILYELWQSYEDWVDNQGDFVQSLLDSILDNDEVINARRSVMIFAEDRAEFFFVNATYYDVDDSAWFGILDKTYHIAVFEAGWFVRHGSGGWSNWGYGWWGSGDQYEKDDGQRVAITYTGDTYDYCPYSAHAILDYDRTSNHDIAGIRPMVMESSSVAPWDTWWIYGAWQTPGINTDGQDTPFG
ncbi:hypothetical protein TWF281_003272 [Arthrobotrys megalospora]